MPAPLHPLTRGVPAPDASAFSGRCFVLEPGLRLLDERKLPGDVEYIFLPEERRPSIFHAHYVEVALDRLAAGNYDHTLDAIVMTGPQVPLTQIVAGIAARVSSLLVAFWDAPGGRYVVRPVGDV